MWWRFPQPQRLRQWQLPAAKPTVSAVAAAHCVTFGFKCDGLIMSCVYEAWARTNEHDVLVFTESVTHQQRAMTRCAHKFYLRKREPNFYGVPQSPQEKYSYRTRGGIACSSSQTTCPLTEKELHQLRMDEEALKETLEEEAMNKKAQEEKISKNKPKIMHSF
ncbi:hypothetical protein Tco_0450587 [Tanacetum coccineum]